ncbi:hypothetical protein C0389_00605 [bacterium]|nr:hypothetical protein [bacterium]
MLKGLIKRCFLLNKIIITLNLIKLYAVFFLPILKWLDNRITEKYFLSMLELNEQSLGFVQNK